MGGFFGGKPKVAAPAPVPTETDPAVEEAKRKAREEEKRRKGYASTIMTGGQGETESQLNIGTKTLLGQ